MNSAPGVLLHGEWWDVSELDDATRRKMSESIEALVDIDVVRSSSTGADLFDDKALIVLIVLDSLEALARYRTQPAYQSMAAYIQPLGLYPDKMVQFNLEMSAGAPALRPNPRLLLHGCQIDAAKADDRTRDELAVGLRDFGSSGAVRAGTAGPDLLATDALSQAFFFNSEDGLRRYRQQPSAVSVETVVAREQLPWTQFTLDLHTTPW